MIIWNIDNQGVSAPRGLSNVWVRGILESTGPCKLHCNMLPTLNNMKTFCTLCTLCTLCNCEMCNCAICAIVKLAFWLHYEWMVTPVKIMQCCGCTYTGKGSLTLACIFSLVFIFYTFAACALLLCLLLFCFIFYSTTFFWLLFCSIFILLICHAVVLFWQN